MTNKKIKIQIYGGQSKFDSIVQGDNNSLNSQMAETKQVKTDNFEKAIQDLRHEISQLNLSKEDSCDIELQIATLENQSKSSRKSPTVIQGTLDTISNIVQGAAGSGLWQILSQIGTLL